MPLSERVWVYTFQYMFIYKIKQTYNYIKIVCMVYNIHTQKIEMKMVELKEINVNSVKLSWFFLIHLFWGEYIPLRRPLGWQSIHILPVIIILSSHFLWPLSSILYYARSWEYKENETYFCPHGAQSRKGDLTGIISWGIIMYHDQYYKRYD